MLCKCCRGQPPDYVLREAKNTSKFFKCVGSVQNTEISEVLTHVRSAYQALTEEEYEAVSCMCYCFGCVGSISKMNILDLLFKYGGHSFSSIISFWHIIYSIVICFVSIQRELKKPSIGKEYFNHMNLEAIVTNYPYRKNLPKEDIVKGQLL